ncbi:MAG: NUDIX domain-containing protein [Candidatus Liptonbacteria bacterium]|nr:NUDIX domain-containing protein [Candidatus Liptonbacteria bacterium]
MPHINEKLDFTVEVFVVNKGKVLLRKHDKYELWLGLGGHIDPGSDPTEACHREAMEEAGIEIEIFPKPDEFGGAKDKELPAPQFVNRHWINDKHEHVAFIFFAKTDTDKVREPDNHEKSGGMKWFGAEDLDDPKYGIEPNVIHYAKTALEASKLIF